VAQLSAAIMTITSTGMAAAALWTRDKRLAASAAQLGLAIDPALSQSRSAR
jgi:hypothetical protein